MEKNEKRYYTVADVCTMLSITRKTLFYYDKQNLLIPTRRVGAQNFKEYDDAAIIRLKEILKYRSAGLSIQEIKILLDDPTCNKRELLQNALERSESLLEIKKEEILKLRQLIDEL